MTFFLIFSLFRLPFGDHFQAVLFLGLVAEAVPFFAPRLSFSRARLLRFLLWLSKLGVFFPPADLLDDLHDLSSDPPGVTSARTIDLFPSPHKPLSR